MQLPPDTKVVQALCRGCGTMNFVKVKRQLKPDEYPENSIDAAVKHHKKHGDMDGLTCLLGACALHYPC